MVSIKVVSSYIVDWLLLIAVALVGYAINNITPNKHAFSLDDRNISFPLYPDTVSVAVLAIVSAIVPIVIIFVVTFLFVPGPTVPKGTPQSLIWKRRLWELHAGWLGLALSLVSAWFIVSSMKNLFGKPRPNLLARCQPDLENIANYVVGGVLTPTSDGRLVTAAICQNSDSSVIDEGFRSFPSGHSSFSAAGLIYLSLFLASKLGAFVPFLHPITYPKDETTHSAFPSRLGYRQSTSPIPLESQESDQHTAVSPTKDIPSARKEAAAPPLYLLIATVIPFFAAVYISSSRWYDYQHHGFDILFGFTIGLITPLLAFRYYHLPLGRGAGWAWSPRSKDKAFWAGLGSNSYARDRDLPVLCDEQLV
ncbi:PAP2 superfamily-domain-containing protein [Truncatella angustata]|uniref:PAP2 superfamily-domain-containing protein n=1 Tax=Truncatella angustata TaxID=152316 RepID=A0A9P8UU63_9PEZI|nr:PAP2 superfamily-domain-containing protein [Truncatella angustata]KAH6658572.1 PAP2 superfamily-domain-containing protein [Truncatella angustata]